MQEDLTGAAFHPLDDNLLITHGRGHLTFWNRRKDGFFERTDIIKPASINCTQLIVYASSLKIFYRVCTVYTGVIFIEISLG